MNSFLVFHYNFGFLCTCWNIFKDPSGRYFSACLHCQLQFTKIALFICLHCKCVGITFVAHEMHFYENCTVTQKEVLILSIFQSWTCNTFFEYVKSKNETGFVYFFCRFINWFLDKNKTFCCVISIRIKEITTKLGNWKKKWMKSRAQCEKVLSAAQKYEAPYLLHVVYFCKSKLTNGFLLFCALFCYKRWEHILSAQEKNLCYAVFSIARAHRRWRQC